MKLFYAQQIDKYHIEIPYYLIPTQIEELQMMDALNENDEAIGHPYWIQLKKT